MSGTRQSCWLLVAASPAVAWVALHSRAQAFIATWNVAPGAPEAPLTERIAVAVDNMAVRVLPAAAGFLLMLLPVLVILAGRRMAQSTPVAAMRQQGAVWTVLCVASAVIIGAIQAGLRDASQVVLWEAAHWVAWCLCAAALINMYGLVTTTGQLPFRAFIVPGILVAFLVGGTYGLVGSVVALQVWLVASEALSRGRLTTR